MSSLKGKVAMITGAARGIGRAVAVRLARAGADLALCDLSEDLLADTAAETAALGVTVRCYPLNVADPEAARETVRSVTEAWGRLDILVNNAGITRDGLLPRLRDEDWDAVLDVNLKGAFHCTRAAARPMMKQRSGAIVNVASIIGIIGNAGQSNYAASKGGLIAFTKSVARELAARGVRANAVAPGFISTAMTDRLPEAVRQKMLEAIPLGRFGNPEDVANVVAFLAGDEASYVTGQTLTVCGGMVT